MMYEARLKNIVWIMERGEEGVRKRKEDRREGESEGGREVVLGSLTQMPSCGS